MGTNDAKGSRHIKPQVTALLWGRAAGRCQFSGCNKLIERHELTLDPHNLAERAHIHAHSDDGPRALPELDPELRNELDNLMLLCAQCHKAVDDQPAKYDAELLRAWKREHEQRVELVTGLVPDKKSHVLLYGAKIGEASAPLDVTHGRALWPHRYPAEARPIRIELAGSAQRDHDQGFWELERTNLQNRFARQVAERMDHGVQDRIAHLSVFAAAPQPLLIQLGVLLGDLPGVDVFQLHREPSVWSWTDDGRELGWTVDSPTNHGGPAALVFSLSATVTHDRIQSVLGQDACIWTVTIARPHNDFLQSREHLGAFRRLIRPLMDDIKAQQGQTTPLHIFPAMPVAAAVELGRTRMPKADMPWRLYDQNNQLGGFAYAFEIA